MDKGFPKGGGSDVWEKFPNNPVFFLIAYLTIERLPFSEQRHTAQRWPGADQGDVLYFSDLPAKVSVVNVLVKVNQTEKLTTLVSPVFEFYKIAWSVVELGTICGHKTTLRT